MQISFAPSSQWAWYKAGSCHVRIRGARIDCSTSTSAVIVLRICYVYSKNNVARVSMIVCFVICTISTLVIYGRVWHDIDPVALDLPGLKVTGCSAPPSREVWKVFAPNLVLHTILYLATTIPAFYMRRRGKRSQMMDRLVRECVLLPHSVLFPTVSLSSSFLPAGELCTPRSSVRVSGD